MKVLLLTRYGRLGSSSRVRILQYIPMLKSDGIEVSVSPLLDSSYLERRYAGRSTSFLQLAGAYGKRLAAIISSRRFDLVWIESEALPWLPATLESVLMKASVPYIVDYDDAMFHRYDRHANGIVRRLLGDKIDRVMKGSALVVAGNAYIARRARHAGASHVEIIPSVVDLSNYPTGRPPRKDHSRPFTVGWVGSPSTAGYLESIFPALTEFHRNRDFRLILVGAKTSTKQKFPVEMRKWSEASEAVEISGFDVGIMPLTDDPWSRGKCGYKLIQYMACGIPVIASPVGVNIEIVEPGVNGLLAYTSSEWLQALEMFYNDADLRMRMGIHGRQKVEEKYCLQKTGPVLEALMHQIPDIT